MSTDNTQTLAARDAAPEGFMMNMAGHLVPVSLVKPIDKLRDQTVNDLVLSALDVSAMLKKLKEMAFSDISTFVRIASEQYQVEIGGDKGNVTLHTYDGRFKIVRQVQESLQFDERLQGAKALLDEFFAEVTEGARAEVSVLINEAFRADKAGYVRTDRVLELRRVDIKDERWLRAMDMISDSLQVVGSTTYVRFYRRIEGTGRYEAIPLDLASV